MNYRFVATQPRGGTIDGYHFCPLCHSCEPRGVTPPGVIPSRNLRLSLLLQGRVWIPHQVRNDSPSNQE